MRVLKSDFKHGLIKLLVQSSDDLWYLSHIISKGDFVSGYVERRISVGEKEGERKTIFAKLEVEKLEFSEFTSVLRVTGLIRESSDERVPLGEHQSINVSTGDDLTIEKSAWTVADNDYLNRSVKRVSGSEVLIVSCDYGDASFAYYHDYGIENLGTLSEEIGGKKELKTYEKNRETFLKLLLSKTEEAALNRKVKAVLIGGAAMITDNLKNMIKDYSYLKDKTTLAKISYSGKNGVSELLKRGEVDKIVSESLYSTQVSVVNKLLELISKEGNAIYALSHVKPAVEAGAASDVLLTTNYIKKAKSAGKYAELDDLLKLVESSGGKIHIIESNSEPGETIDNLSGIAAITRYKTE